MLELTNAGLTDLNVGFSSWFVCLLFRLISIHRVVNVVILLSLETLNPGFHACFNSHGQSFFNLHIPKPEQSYNSAGKFLSAKSNIFINWSIHQKHVII